MGEYINTTITEMLDKLEKDRYISPEKTIEFGLKVYSLCVDENYETGMASALWCLGLGCLNMSKYEKAISYLFASINLSLIHDKKTNYVQSEKYFFKALQLTSEIDYVYSKIDLLLDFSNFLENAGKGEIAINKLEEVYNISIDNKMYAKTMEICKQAIRLYEKSNDIDNAYRYYKLYFESQKKLEHIELENRVKNFKTKVKLGSLEEENKSIVEKSEALRIKSEDLMEIIKSISIISELGEKITTTLVLEQIYEMLYSSIESFMQANIFGVGIYNNEERIIEYKYLIENNVKKQMHETNFDNESSMAVKCLRENKIIVINDMHNEYLNYVDDVNYITDNKENYDLNSAIYCPLIIDNNLIGVITVQALEKDSFTRITIEMVKVLSSYATIAINNAMKSRNLLIEIEQKGKFQTQLQNINSKLIHLSENDGLTDIPNRRKFDSIIIEQWNKAKDKKSAISIIIFDIDCFKQYNDNYGHTAGDSCLLSISSELSKSLVKDYFAARYGGDEFVILLQNTNLEEANRYGENFRRNIEKLSLTHKFSKVKDIVTVTLGV